MFFVYLEDKQYRDQQKIYYYKILLKAMSNSSKLYHKVVIQLYIIIRIRYLSGFLKEILVLFCNLRLLLLCLPSKNYKTGQINVVIQSV